MSAVSSPAADDDPVTAVLNVLSQRIRRKETARGSAQGAPEAPTFAIN